MREGVEGEQRGRKEERWALGSSLHLCLYFLSRTRQSCSPGGRRESMGAKEEGFSARALGHVSEALEQRTKISVWNAESARKLHTDRAGMPLGLRGVL